MASQPRFASRSHYLQIMAAITVLVTHNKVFSCKQKQLTTELAAKTLLIFFDRLALPSWTFCGGERGASFFCQSFSFQVFCPLLIYWRFFFCWGVSLAKGILFFMRISVLFWGAGYAFEHVPCQIQSHVFLARFDAAMSLSVFIYLQNKKRWRYPLLLLLGGGTLILA